MKLIKSEYKEVKILFLNTENGYSEKILEKIRSISITGRFLPLFQSKSLNNSAYENNSSD